MLVSLCTSPMEAEVNPQMWLPSSSPLMVDPQRSDDLFMEHLDKPQDTIKQALHFIRGREGAFATSLHLLQDPEVLPREPLRQEAESLKNRPARPRKKAVFITF